MSAVEAFNHFGDLAQRGLVAEQDGAVLGFTGFNLDGQGLYAHSMFCLDEGHACAALCQALRRLARELKQPQLRFVVNADNPHFLRFVNNGRATIHSYVVSLSIQEDPHV